MQHLYGLVGVGGFGREVMPVAQRFLEMLYQQPDFELVFVVEGVGGDRVNGHRVLSADEFLSTDGVKYFNIAISNSSARERIATKFIESNVEPFSITALNSICMDNNEIGEGAILCPFTTITSNAKIGRFFHANLYSYIAHDCIIGDFVTFAPHVHCNGRVVVEDHAYIGTGAILQNATESPLVIGRGAVVGMGAVVTKSVPPYTTVIGSPAVPF